MHPAGATIMALAQRVMTVLTSPERAWRVIDGERGNIRALFGDYVAYLAAIPAVAGFIGMSIVGFTVPSVGTYRVGVVAGLLAALVQYVATFATVYIVALVANALAPRFDGERDMPSALKLIAYSFTPAWLSGIFLLLPGLQFLTICGLYGVYILYRGLPILMRSPPERAPGYAAAIVASALAIGLVIAAFRAALFSLPGLI
jgi:hypothetical protein